MITGERDPDDHFGLLRVSRDNGREVGTLSPGEEKLVSVHAQLALHLVLVVTLVALGLQDGNDKVSVDDTLAQGDFGYGRLFPGDFFDLGCITVNFEAYKEEWFQWLGGVFDEVVTLMNHGASEVATGHRSPDGGKSSEG